MSRHAAPPPGARRVPVLNAARFRPGDQVTIGQGTRHRQRLRVVGIAGELAVWVVPWRWYHTTAAVARQTFLRNALRTARAVAWRRRQHPVLVGATRTAPEGSTGLLEPSGAVRLLTGGDDG
ncbi:MAG: hypothetical protein M0030_11525 [Actinomycetota bacterium]|nr:hypothetical protein [Actinomycetota bacterium]